MYGGIIHEKGVENTKEWVGIRRRDFSFNLAELRNTASTESFCWNYKIVKNKTPLEIFIDNKMSLEIY